MMRQLVRLLVRLVHRLPTSVLWHWLKRKFVPIPLPIQYLIGAGLLCQLLPDRKMLILSIRCVQWLAHLLFLARHKQQQ